VDRLQEATGWQEPRWNCDWSETESALGALLPSDYKELCSRFGPGYFSDYIRVLFDEGEESLLAWWQREVDLYRQHASEIYAPYEPYGVSRQKGVITWCSSEWGSFFWLADAAKDSNSWPIMAKVELARSEEWQRFDIPVSEFVYRAIADPGFKPFTVAAPGFPPMFWRFEG
jgi:hypothetical protein